MENKTLFEILHKIGRIEFTELNSINTETFLNMNDPLFQRYVLRGITKYQFLLNNWINIKVPNMNDEAAITIFKSYIEGKNLITKSLLDRGWFSILKFDRDTEETLAKNRERFSIENDVLVHDLIKRSLYALITTIYDRYGSKIFLIIFTSIFNGIIDMKFDIDEAARNNPITYLQEIYHHQPGTWGINKRGGMKNNLIFSEIMVKNIREVTCRVYGFPRGLRDLIAVGKGRSRDLAKQEACKIAIKNLEKRYGIFHPNKNRRIKIEDIGLLCYGP
jgi:hypothetical protein